MKIANRILVEGITPEIREDVRRAFCWQIGYAIKTRLDGCLLKGLTFDLEGPEMGWTLEYENPDLIPKGGE